jgi:hypothetical protein
MFQHQIRNYKTFNYPGALPGSRTLLTGIRQTDKEHEYVITGFYEFPNSAFPTVSFVYKGHLNGYGKFYSLNYPSKSGINVATTNLYGPSVVPDKQGIYNIVGNYTQVGITGTLGALYRGTLDGKGKWTTIVPNSLSVHPVLNTIVHSTMGALAVGNYDTNLIQGRAFIYDITEKKYIDIVKQGAASITAYGVWQNSKHHYTIAGGFFNIPGAEAAYLVDYDDKRKQFYNWTEYYFDNNPVKSIVTHFDGISANSDGSGYTLTGDYVVANDPDPKAFFAIVKRKQGRLSKKAKWTTISYPQSNATSGNSVSEDVVIGVYALPNDTTVNGYVSYL